MKKHIAKIQEETNIINEDELDLKEFMGDELYNNEDFKTAIQKDLLSMLCFVFFQSIMKNNKNDKEVNLIELKGLLNQSIVQINFLERIDYLKTDNWFENLVNEFKKAHFEYRKERAYFSTKLIMLIEKELHLIYTKETVSKPKKEKKPPLRSTKWNAPQFAIFFELLQKGEIIKADKIRVIELFSAFAGAGVQGFKDASTKTYLTKSKSQTNNKNLLQVKDDLQKMINEIDNYLIRE